MDRSQYKPRTVYVTYIVAPPEKVWAALTSGGLTTQYFFGRRIESEWNVGAPVRYWQPEGALDVSGTILECDPPRLVAYTWRVEWIEAYRDLPDAIVSFEIDPLGDPPGELSRLTMTESHVDAIDDKLLEGGRRGWPVILSSLKSLLETGRPLPPFHFAPPAEFEK